MPTVVLIDHHGARFYETAVGQARPEERGHIEPKDPHGFERHLEHRKEADYKGERIPEPTEFYERVAERLKASSSIVLVGPGTGKSSAMHYLTEYLEKKHKDVAKRVVRTVEADLSSITLPQIEQAGEGLL